MEDYGLREVRRVLERIEETSNNILKQLEEQTTELHSMGVNVAIVTAIIGTAAMMLLLEFIHQQYHWF